MNVQTTLSASTLVYLYAEEFAEPAKGVLVQAAIAPRNDSKVNLQQLVIATYTAAFMELVEQDIIRLETMEVRKMLVGKETALVAVIDQVTDNIVPSALGIMLLQGIQAVRKAEERRVREVVIRVVGGRRSSLYPWFMALKPIVAEAAEAGYVTLPEKKAGVLKAMFKPTEAITKARVVAEQVNPLQGEVARLKAQLASFDQSLGNMAILLRKEIENGVKACYDND